MAYESYDEFQYDSCISRGICSINPRISALQTVIVLYLRLFAKYLLEVKPEKEIRDFILNTLSITIYNPEFNENSYLFAVEKFRKEFPIAIEKYAEMNSKDVLETEKNKAVELFNETADVIQAIKYGEKILNRGLKQIPTKIRDLYNIMLVIAKSLSINLLDLESFNKEQEDAFSTILNLLSRINLEEKNVETLKAEIYRAAKTDINLMKLIREAQEERYGIQGISEVSYTTVPNKAVLVVGSNIRELETVLEALKDEDIDVYTHDDMMLAHTFPNFSMYPRLKGQFGQGVENCLLDFATFPGPIILTKHSLHNIENFYRGRLFTTDYTTNPKGIVKIEHNDFSKVIEAAEITHGFKSGKQCESVSIGYNFDETIANIKNKIETQNYEKIFLIGLEGYSYDQKAYFEKLIKLVPKNILIISFSYDLERDNLVYINTCFDNYSWVRIFESLYNFDLPITIFIPKCERNTISQMIFFAHNERVKVYLGKCTPIILNPSLMNTLQMTFEIRSITTAKKDLEQILEDK